MYASSANRKRPRQFATRFGDPMGNNLTVDNLLTPELKTLRKSTQGRIYGANDDVPDLIPAVTPLPAGVDFNERIGRRITINSINLKYTINYKPERTVIPGNPPLVQMTYWIQPQVVRCMLIKIENPDWTGIYQEKIAWQKLAQRPVSIVPGDNRDIFLAEIDKQWANNFEILYDATHDMPGFFFQYGDDGTGGIGVHNKQDYNAGCCKPVTIRYDLENLAIPVQYDEGLGLLWTNCKKNFIYFLCFSDFEETNEFYIDGSEKPKNQNGFLQFNLDMQTNYVDC